MVIAQSAFERVLHSEVLVDFKRCDEAIFHDDYEDSALILFVVFKKDVMYLLIINLRKEFMPLFPAHLPLLILKMWVLIIFIFPFIPIIPGYRRWPISIPYHFILPKILIALSKHKIENRRKHPLKILRIHFNS